MSGVSTSILNTISYAAPGGARRRHEVRNGTPPEPTVASASPASPAMTVHDRTGTSRSSTNARGHKETARPRRTSSIASGALTGKRDMAGRIGLTVAALGGAIVVTARSREQHPGLSGCGHGGGVVGV